MNSLVKILHFENRMGSLNSDWFRDIVTGVFEFETYVPGQSYVPGTLFYANCVTTTPAELEYLHSRNFRILYDNLWELYRPPQVPAHVMHTVNWCWYNESLWYSSLGLDQYVPNRTYQYLALMPMRLQKRHRTFLVDNLGPKLDRMIWSYVAQGRQLPNDGDMNDWNTQRYFNPEWYDQTYCSVVAETEVDHYDPQPVLISEKTYKAIAFQHPFIIYGNRNTISMLHKQGFETYNNLWSEKYDEIPDPETRGHAVVDIIKSILPVPHSKLTLQKIAHNRNRFFDRAVVRQGVINEIINPILEYAETR